MKQVLKNALIFFLRENVLSYLSMMQLQLCVTERTARSRLNIYEGIFFYF